MREGLAVLSQTGRNRHNEIAATAARTLRFPKKPSQRLRGLADPEVIKLDFAPVVASDAGQRQPCPAHAYCLGWRLWRVSRVPAPPLLERSERRCLKPLRASTHDDFRAYA